jgi:hypothetical protein
MMLRITTLKWNTVAKVTYEFNPLRVLLMMKMGSIKNPSQPVFVETVMNGRVSGTISDGIQNINRIAWSS